MIKDIGIIKYTMNKQFLTRVVELSIQLFQNNLDSLKKNLKELLIEYYNRVKEIIERFSAKIAIFPILLAFLSIHY